MAVDVKVVNGSVANGGSGTKTAFTSTGFGTPDFAVVLLSAASTSNNPSSETDIGFGVLDNTTNGFNVSISSNARRTNDNALFYTHVDYLVRGEFTTDGINLWEEEDITSDIYATVILFSGVTNVDCRYVTAQGGGALSGLSFSPNALIALSIGASPSNTAPLVGLISIGFASKNTSGITQGCVLYDETQQTAVTYNNKITGQAYNKRRRWIRGGG